MATLRAHTKRYSDEQRARLGVAISRAREAAGHQWRPSFAKSAGISVRSLVKLETGVPVGASVYEAAARALPNWTEDTPVSVLEDGPIPVPMADPVQPARPEPGSAEWLRHLAHELTEERFKEVVAVYKELQRQALARQALDAERDSPDISQ